MNSCNPLKTRLLHHAGRSHFKRFIAKAGVLACAAHPAAQAMSLDSSSNSASPLGFVSAINTPVAQVLQTGGVLTLLTNNIPEKTNPYPGVGGFGTLSLGLGLLEGLEAFGRLSFSGDLQCNAYSNGCQSGQRDLSVSGKYQFPIQLPFNTRFAAGVTDYGGAATNFRSKYVVATSDLGVLDVSLGFAQKSSPSALLDGRFGSVVLRITDQLKLQYENNSRSKRIGASYFFNIGKHTDLSLGLSQQAATATQPSNRQVGVALVMNLGQKQAKLIRETETFQSSQYRSSPQEVPSTLGNNQSNEYQTARDTSHQVHQTLRDSLHKAGFSRIQISQTASNLLWVQAETTSWRQSRLQAMGVALQTLLNQPELANFNQWLLTLTFEGQPVMNALTSSHCAQSFKSGFDHCGDHQAIEFFTHSNLPQKLQQELAAETLKSSDTSSSWKSPQFELGFNLRNAIGTEYGLADYSAALELTTEVSLAKGLGLQATASTPLAHSGDFAQGRVFSDRLHGKSQIEQALLTYWQPYGSFAIQGSAGYINTTDRGGQLDGSWHNQDGRFRLSGLVGHYTNTEGKYIHARMPVLMAMRYSVLPAKWQMEITAGQFYNQDRGYLLASNHWMGDTKFKIYFRKSGLTADPLKPVRSFAGIEISLPLGPERASTLAGFNFRGQDRWQAGAETKVGETDNYITLGYGFIPKPRHGLMTDILDFDRSGFADIWADRDRVRLAMRTIQ